MDAELETTVQRLKNHSISKNHFASAVPTERRITGYDGIDVYIQPPPKDLVKEYNELFTKDAVQFMIDLVLRFEVDIEDLYNRRLQRKLDIINSKTPKFVTRRYQNDDWKIAPVGRRLQNRHLDLGDVSPSDLPHFCAALRSPVQGIQVDFDDGHCPTWRNQITGIYNVGSAVRGLLMGVPPISEAPVLMLRPRAWNMIEKNISINGRRVPGPLVDFSLLIFHNAALLLEKTGENCSFYLSKLEGATEARLWRQIFEWTESRLNFPHGSIKACVLIENILSAFEMDAILWELREHSLGLNCGIWDYSATIISKFGANNANFLLPDRKKYVNVSKRFLRSYMRLVVETCRRRAAPATGGMAANLLPSRGSPDYDRVLKTVWDAKAEEINMGLVGFMVYDLGLVDSMNRLWSLAGNLKSKTILGGDLKGTSVVRESLTKGVESEANLMEPMALNERNLNEPIAVWSNLNGPTALSEGFNESIDFSSCLSILTNIFARVTGDSKRSTKNLDESFAELAKFNETNAQPLNLNEPITEEDLLSLPTGGVTSQGLDHNISVGILFVHHWLIGKGHFFFKGFVEDSATAEISRSQVWQWIRFGAQLEDEEGRVTRSLVVTRGAAIARQLLNIYGTSLDTSQKLMMATQIFLEIVNRRDFPEFITTYLNDENTFGKIQSNL